MWTIFGGFPIVNCSSGLDPCCWPTTFVRLGRSFTRRRPLPHGAPSAACHPRRIRATGRLAAIIRAYRFKKRAKQSNTRDGRVPRKMPSTKRSGDADDGSESPNKIARTDAGPQHGQQQHLHLQQPAGATGYTHGDYGSSGSKKRGGGGASTRTGQACDRCKVRTTREIP